ncbi:hypothetical protein J2847_003039 [Azospirillum agricola]|uniref:hypothetical protein n=1 Tax=Azospirillum agricola TaxID=1720247 RepID=UPI001AE4174C|nr:hypothetical protein [Azospirillum agricola]MBP2229740.1 hypothetical protein [Azospirillum agricola]
MPPTERARRLSRALQARFRIDLFSTLVERDFERHLTDAILAAERTAFQRGRDSVLGQTALGQTALGQTALGQTAAASREGQREDGLPLTATLPRPSAGESGSTSA